MRGLYSEAEEASGKPGPQNKKKTLFKGYRAVFARPPRYSKFSDRYNAKTKDCAANAKSFNDDYWQMADGWLSFEQ